MKNVKRVNITRRYSKAFKKERVAEYERKEFTVRQLSRMYGFSPQSMYNWIYKYSKYSEQNIQIVEHKQSSSEKLKKVVKENKKLKEKLGEKQIELDYLHKLIEVAEEDYGMNIKKNSDMPHSDGSEKTNSK